MGNDFGQNFGAHLRGLRLILGADNKPISGERFSELTGILPGTLHSVETNRRRLGEADAERIKNRLGAKWNSVPWRINLAASPEYQKMLKKGPPSRR